MTLKSIRVCLFLLMVFMFTVAVSNLVGQVGTTSYTDRTSIGGGLFFYRIGLQP